jgi:hypothetical protein
MGWDGREIIGMYEAHGAHEVCLKCMVMVMVIITWLDVAHGNDDPY